MKKEFKKIKKEFSGKGQLKKAQLKIQVHKNPLGFLVPEFSKSQLKIQEMSFMIVAVVLFFVLVGLFGFSVLYSNILKNADVINEERTYLLVNNFANSPELNCAGGKTNCVDADKIIGLMNNKNYQNFWEITSLEVLKQSGFNKTEAEMTECSMDNLNDCDKFLIIRKNAENEEKIVSFAAICRSEYENYYNYEKCEIAKLIVGREVKG